VRHYSMAATDPSNTSLAYSSPTVLLAAARVGKRTCYATTNQAMALATSRAGEELEAGVASAPGECGGGDPLCPNFFLAS
jgi:hypothetical protein